MSGVADYLETGEPAQGSSPVPVTGMGNNPSTYAGLIVLGAVAVLIGMRKSFRRFM